MVGGAHTIGMCVILRDFVVVAHHVASETVMDDVAFGIRSSLARRRGANRQKALAGESVPFSVLTD